MSICPPRITSRKSTRWSRVFTILPACYKWFAFCWAPREQHGGPASFLLGQGEPVITSPCEDCPELPQTPQEWSKWLFPLLVHDHLSAISIACHLSSPFRVFQNPLWQFICFTRCFLSIISAGTNTTELSVIPWCFLSFQGGLEPTPQTLITPCRAAFLVRRDLTCVWPLVSLSQLPCGVLCPQGCQGFDSWLYNMSSQPGVIWASTDVWQL